MSTVDLAMRNLTVRGAGVFGLACAWEAARRGARVRVIDPRGPGAGASGGVVGALAPHAPENWTAAKAFQLTALLASPGFWAGVDATSGLSTGFRRTGRVQPLDDARAVDRARARAECARALWPGPCRWLVTETPPDALSLPSATGLWAIDTLSARLSPAAAVASLAAAIRALGGEIVTEGIEAGGVETGGVEVGAVLHATGWEGLREAGLGGGVKGQAVVLDFAAPEAPQIYADGLHIVFHADGTTAVGSTSERNFDEVATTDAQVEGLIARATAILPTLADRAVLRRWAGVRPRAVTRLPVIGPWPGRPGHFIANGGFKIGFGLAPLVAATLADLILEGRDAIPDEFRPTLP